MRWRGSDNCRGVVMSEPNHFVCMLLHCLDQSLIDYNKQQSRDRVVHREGCQYKNQPVQLTYTHRPHCYPRGFYSTAAMSRPPHVHNHHRVISSFGAYIAVPRPYHQTHTISSHRPQTTATVTATEVSGQPPDSLRPPPPPLHDTTLPRM